MNRTCSVTMFLGVLGATLSSARVAGAQTDAITGDVLARAVASIAERVESPMWWPIPAA